MSRLVIKFVCDAPSQEVVKEANYRSVKDAIADLNRKSEAQDDLKTDLSEAIGLPVHAVTVQLIAEGGMTKEQVEELQRFLEPHQYVLWQIADYLREHNIMGAIEYGPLKLEVRQ